MNIDFSTINLEAVIVLSLGGVLAGVFISMLAIMFNKWLYWLHEP